MSGDQIGGVRDTGECKGAGDRVCECGHMMSSHGPRGCEVEVCDYGVLDCTCTRTRGPSECEHGDHATEEGHYVG